MRPGILDVIGKLENGAADLFNRVDPMSRL